MADATKYNPTVCWKTIASNVVQLTRETIGDPATYKITVSFVDSNDIGAGQKLTGYYFTDFLGNPYSIIATGTSFISVSDDFRTGECPRSGHIGYVHKSAYKGYSLYLPSHAFRHLHPTALQTNNKYAMAILWNNDPNPYRISFSATTEPKIVNYQSLQLDGRNLSEDYGEDPKCRLMQIDESGNIIERTEKPYYELIDGKIDVITFGILPDPIDCYIEISR